MAAMYGQEIGESDGGTPTSSRTMNYKGGVGPWGWIATPSNEPMGSGGTGPARNE